MFTLIDHSRRQARLRPRGPRRPGRRKLDVCAAIAYGGSKCAAQAATAPTQTMHRPREYWSSTCTRLSARRGPQSLSRPRGRRHQDGPHCATQAAIATGQPARPPAVTQVANPEFPLPASTSPWRILSPPPRWCSPLRPGAVCSGHEAKRTCSRGTHVELASQRRGKAFCHGPGRGTATS